MTQAKTIMLQEGRGKCQEQTAELPACLTRAQSNTSEATAESSSEASPECSHEGSADDGEVAVIVHPRGYGCPEGLIVQKALGVEREVCLWRRVVVLQPGLNSRPFI
eukprot:CAMPEP_0196664146 /NCGR_PEP_ID=MMETSP1086-20130531/55921_1 /TAXON_ID=77921 /ORGANISM="Cyanoptyche  gloeocystis , Strain SAG4.97" /LENGTH=106 /DNA_ID=CAMNT_0042000317 /DNA_START=36 /DNA_END=356 /DNA_ORIENTATION=-